MSKLETESLLPEISNIGECSYQAEKLSAIAIYPDNVTRLFLADEDLLKMDKLEVVLHLAGQSTDYGQAQGGSLYFMDLGCAVLQFESPSREFLFFAREHNTGEPLREMSPYSIKSYYEDNAWED